MQISRYQVFVKVVEEGSITRAAEALGYTQSGVSHIIKNLEKELGFVLIIRSNVAFHLTAEGEMVYEAIRRIADGEENLLQVSSSIMGVQAGHIRLGTQCSVSTQWLPDILKTFLEKYPNIRFDLIDNDYDTIEKMLLEDSIEMAFMPKPLSNEFEIDHLLNDEYYLVVNREHRLAGRGRVSVRELAGESFISSCEGLNYRVGDLCRRYGVVPDVHLSVRDDSGTLAMVRAGLGVTILSDLLIRCYDTSELALLEFEEDAYRDLVLACHRGRDLPPAARLFKKHVIEWCSENA